MRCPSQLHHNCLFRYIIVQNRKPPAICMDMDMYSECTGSYTSLPVRLHNTRAEIITAQTELCTYTHYWLVIWLGFTCLGKPSFWLSALPHSHDSEHLHSHNWQPWRIYSAIISQHSEGARLCSYSYINMLLHVHTYYHSCGLTKGLWGLLYRMKEDYMHLCISP